MALFDEVLQMVSESWSATAFRAFRHTVTIHQSAPVYGICRF